MSDQLVTEATANVAHNKYMRQTCMPSAGFEPTSPEIKWLETYMCSCMATGTDIYMCYFDFSQ